MATQQMTSNLLDKSIHSLIEQQVARTPHALAVTFADQSLTYLQLNSKANQLASHLRSLGVGPETLVGVCLERSLDMLIALLGILKAGGAYIPLDPHYPQDRLAYVIENSQLKTILTQQPLLEVLPGQPQVQHLCLDSSKDVLEAYPTQDLAPLSSGDNLAYIIYTSGSTGKPKGVEITHSAAVNFLESMAQEPGLEATDRLLAVTTISFDIAVLELYLPLTRGAQVVIASRESVSDGEQLQQLLSRHNITLLQATPATWRLLISTGWSGHRQLKMLCGGEAMPRALANQLLERGGSLWNMYGPTETTVWSAVHRVEPGNEPVPIGHAIANTQLYIIDTNNRRADDALILAPTGEIGELYIGGQGVARGYFQRPDLTQERFVPDSFGPHPGQRLYKTGDLARFKPDGTLEFIGRADQQVKIRGFRVELGDIEFQMSQHPGVKAAAVIAKEDTSGHKRLVAYFSPHENFNSASPNTADIPESLTPSPSVSQWQQIWDAAYQQPKDLEDPTFNVNGWKDSYTGQATPLEQMQEWLDHTVRSILALKPGRLLEIGCGTGMILFRVAHHCQHYTGLDISSAALNHIQSHLADQGLSQEQVCLKQLAAHDINQLSGGHYDTIVINSVAQYFPSADYLVQVLEKAAELLEPGGKIFIGDIRALHLLETFHSSVQLAQADDALSLQMLHHQISDRVAKEKELVLDPAYFQALQHKIPTISQVRYALKKGHYHNELTRFRYDVTLWCNADLNRGLLGTAAVPQSVDWAEWGRKTPAELKDYLNSTPWDRFVIKGVSNLRVAADVEAMEAIAQADPAETVGSLRQQLAGHEPLAIDPQAWWDLEAQVPYAIELLWTPESATGKYDVIFQKRSDRTDSSAAIWAPPCAAISTDLSQYANAPYLPAEPLAAQIRNFLKSQLPDYMVPSLFVEMAALPLTLNGKIDRRALPEPDNRRGGLETQLVLPGTPMGRQIAEIWCRLLEIDQVGIHDSFFDLGGHSLLTAQMLSSLKESLKVDIPLFYLFKDPTISGLISAINLLKNRGGDKSAENLNTVDLRAEAILAKDIQPTTPFAAEVSNPRRVFLTGATGFVGAFLLRDLIQHTSAQIYCLVRAANTTEGLYRIQHNLERYALWSDSLYDHIVPVLGDLTKPFLGLSEQTFGALAEQIDVIYHSGAQINLVYPYSALKASNVTGSQTLLRLAAQRKTKPLHFLSTLDVFQSPAYIQRAVLAEDDPLDQAEGLYRGYAQTKWVAEQLMQAGRRRGIPISIYRPEMISGHSQTGASQPNDLLSRFFKGIVQMGAVPKIARMMHMVPVDYVSQAILALSQDPAALGGTYHLANTNPMPFEQLVDEICQMGFLLEPIDYSQWKSRLEDLTSQDDNALAPLISLFTDSSEQESYLEISLLSAQIFDCSQALNHLQKASVVCPPVSRELIKTYFNYFMRSDFIQAPIQAPTPKPHTSPLDLTRHLPKEDTVQVIGSPS